ncbi:TadE/TadG family type IV pilus assembly protein [Streptomyces sp. NPDC006430]|uniref:TadE/TadG family type IV pilus assembly protein n=1 Tax=Streptomyces sp. NPDC006430 TaxID=3154299 RepID=UPI0033A9A55C
MNRHRKWSSAARDRHAATAGAAGAGHAAGAGRAGRAGHAGRASRAGMDRGQVALEYIGFVPILLFVALCGIQLGWVGYVHQQADTAARTAARVEARHGSGGKAAGEAAVKASLGAKVDVSKDDDAVTAIAVIPINSIVPGLSIPEARATAIMPNDDPKGPRP